MKTDFYAFQQEVEQRRSDLGLTAEPSDEALRNKGESRTAAKRQFLSRIDRRAAAAGKPSTRSYY